MGCAWCVVYFYSLDIQFGLQLIKCNSVPLNAQETI